MKFEELNVLDDGFEIVADGRTVTVVWWRDIQRVIGFKRDLLTTDLVCLAFEVQWLTPGSQLEINEEVNGFESVVSAMAQQLRLRRDWRREVMRPAFARSETVLFEAHE